MNAIDVQGIQQRDQIVGGRAFARVGRRSSPAAAVERDDAVPRLHERRRLMLPRLSAAGGRVHQHHGDAVAAGVGVVHGDGGLCLPQDQRGDGKAEQSHALFLLDEDGARRSILVLEEAWACLGNVEVARWLRGLQKLSRQYGVPVVMVLHRFSDLVATGDQGSEVTRIAAGLPADPEPQVIHGMAAAEVPTTRDLLGLSQTEAGILGELPQLHGGVVLTSEERAVEELFGAFMHRVERQSQSQCNRELDR